MKKSKFLMGLLALSLISGTGYMVTHNKDQQIVNASSQISEDIIDEATIQEATIEEVVTTTEAQEIMDNIQGQMLEANVSFEEDGMTNIYPKLRTGQKKKWLRLVNENNYFGNETLQYQISGIYELGDKQYYILGWSALSDNQLKLADKWNEEEKEAYVAQDVFELILREEDGNYFVTQAIYPTEQILSSEEVALYKKEEQAESNVTIAYDKVRKLEGVDEYITYLEDTLAEATEEDHETNDTTINDSIINDAGKSEVTQYVQYAIENLSTTSTVAQENTIDVSTALLDEMKETMLTAKDKFSTLLDENDISLNKSLNSILKLETEATDFKKPIYIKLPETVEDLGEVTGLRVVIDDHNYVYINGEDLESLAGLQIKIERLKDKKSYEISFLNQQGEIIPQLEQTITFAFKAKDEFTTVVKIDGGMEQNWGGQYEAATGSVSFGTKYSGTYKVIDNNVKIRDIGHLTNSQQSAIKFMVSKGYLTLENDCFNPEHTFTRYEFAQALVKMFFALDTSLETSLTDVPKDSEYYPYVASGETYEIIKGFADGTFKGDTNILKEQVISLCARTIADQKGYVYPAYPQDYLKFADTDEIGKWALEDIALAVQSGLTTSGGSLTPKAEITKAESAEVLYELFMLLYETAPGNVVEMTATQKTYSILGVLLVLALVLWLVWKVIKRFAVFLTMIACTVAIIITLIIGFKGGF